MGQNMFDKIYVPRTRQDLIQTLVGLGIKKPSALRKMEKCQLYAIYFGKRQRLGSQEAEKEV